MSDNKRYDIAIVIALEEESKLLLKAFSGTKTNDRALGVYTISDIAFSDDSPLSVFKIALILINDQGPEQASNATTQFLANFTTDMLISTGISGRLSDDCALGDVIIAKSSDNYSYRMRIGKSGAHSAGRLKETSNIAEIINRIPLDDYLQGLEPAISQQLKSPLLERGILRKYPKLHYGDITSGPYLIDNEEFQCFLKSKNRLLLAVDMESNAVLEAAANANFQGTTFVVRGVSDLADGSKKTQDGKFKGKIRATAMRAASFTIKYFIEDCFERRDFRFIPRQSLNTRKPIVQRLLGLANGLEASITNRSHQEIAEQVLAYNKDQDSHANIYLLSEFAFRHFVNNYQDTPKTLSDHFKITSPYVINGLVAHFVISSISCPRDGSNDRAILALENVYPSGVNKFCREFMAIEFLQNGKGFLQKLQLSYEYTTGNRKNNRNKKEEYKDIHRRAQIAYLMGRLYFIGKNAQLKVIAIETLQKWLDELLNHIISKSTTPTRGNKIRQKKIEAAERYTIIASAASESKEIRLLLRTLQISLISLGQQDIAEDYILQCLANEKYDNQNRGFHLEYYEDTPSILGERLNNEDNLDVDFPNTFEALKKSMQEYSMSAMHDVQFYTLLSLAQHRHINHKLLPHRRDYVLKLANNIQFISKNSLISGFHRLAISNLEMNKCPKANILEKIFSLKKSPRRGWNNIKKGRAVNNPESIASHTFGAMALGYMLLPESNQATNYSLPANYSKDHILRLILIHDIAEAWTDDLLPEEKSDEYSLEEEKIYELISASHSMSGYCSESIYRDWMEFNDGTTINSRIARDLDLLDNLLQLDIEHLNPGSSIPDYAEWVKYINDRLSDWGRRVFGLVHSL